MILEEKIDQRIILDCRSGEPTGSSNQDMTAPAESIGKLIKTNQVGGVLLFDNSLKASRAFVCLVAYDE
jgi:beta-N-acetylhexosaminidase